MSRVKEPLKLRSSTRNVLSQNLKESEQYRKHAIAIQRELRSAAMTLGAKRQQFLRDKCKLLHDLDINVEEKEDRHVPCLQDLQVRTSKSSVDSYTHNDWYVREYFEPEGQRRAKSCPQSTGDDSTLVDILEYETTTLDITKAFDDMDVSRRDPEIKHKPMEQVLIEPALIGVNLKSSKPTSVIRKNEKGGETTRTLLTADRTADQREVSFKTQTKHRHRCSTLVSKPRAFLLSREQVNTQRKVKEFLDKTSGSKNYAASDASDLQSVSDQTEFATNPNAWMETAAERKRRVNRVYPAETKYYIPAVDSSHSGSTSQDTPTEPTFRLPPLLLPPIHRSIQPLPLRRRSWTPEKRTHGNYEEDTEEPGPITDKEWDDLKRCRYLRISNTSHGSLRQNWHSFSQ